MTFVKLWSTDLKEMKINKEKSNYVFEAAFYIQNLFTIHLKLNMV